MENLLKGAPVAEALKLHYINKVETLQKAGVEPGLVIFRVGDRPDSLAYERGASKRCRDWGIRVQTMVFPEDTGEEELLQQIEQLNRDEAVHGVLMLLPLPKHLNEKKICQALAVEKDVDGITEGSMAAVYAGMERGFMPCTAEACLEILKYYQYPIRGAKAVVVGRSTVIGRPVAMGLLKENATVTICHTSTRDLAECCRGADILVAAAGKAGLIGPECAAPGQILLDVGINVNEQGKLCGDAAPEVLDLVKAGTPVPGGVGAVTTSILAAHVVQSACRKFKI